MLSLVCLLVDSGFGNITVDECVLRFSFANYRGILDSIEKL